jgi:hypothetical protein
MSTVVQTQQNGFAPCRGPNSTVRTRLATRPAIHSTLGGIDSFSDEAFQPELAHRLKNFLDGACNNFIREGGSSGAANMLSSSLRRRKEANRLRHSLYPIRKAVPSSTIARSTVMTHSALREGNTEENRWRARQRAIDDFGKAERRNLPERRRVSLRRYPELPLDIQHFHWKPPFVTRRNTAYARKLRIGC